ADGHAPAGGDHGCEESVQYFLSVGHATFAFPGPWFGPHRDRLHRDGERAARLGLDGFRVVNHTGFPVVRRDVHPARVGELLDERGSWVLCGAASAASGT